MFHVDINCNWNVKKRLLHTDIIYLVFRGQKYVSIDMVKHTLENHLTIPSNIRMVQGTISTKIMDSVIFVLTGHKRLQIHTAHSYDMLHTF